MFVFYLRGDALSPDFASFSSEPPRPVGIKERMSTATPTADTTIEATAIPNDWLAQDSISTIEFCPVQHQPNTDFLAAAAWDGSVRIFRITWTPAAMRGLAPTITNAEPWHLYNHQGPALSLAWSFDGMYLFSGESLLLRTTRVVGCLTKADHLHWAWNRRRRQGRHDVQLAGQDAEPSSTAQWTHQCPGCYASLLGSTDARHWILGQGRQEPQGGLHFCFYSFACYTAKVSALSVLGLLVTSAHGHCACPRARLLYGCHH